MSTSDTAAEEMGLFGAWWVYVLGLIIAASVVFAVLRPWFLNQETKAVRASNSYVTTVQTSLRTLKTSHDSLTVKKVEATDNPELVAAYDAQQQAILAQMRLEADKVNPDKVPADIRTLIGR